VEEIGNSFGWASTRVSKIQELRDELKLVFSGRGAGILDALIPFLVYILTDRLANLNLALILSAGTAIVLLIWRLLNKQSLAFALGGLGTTTLAALLAFLGGTEGGFYLPGFITGGLTVIACFASVFFGRPLAAYSSHLTRRWPLDWYWHARVKPAYSQVSIFWGIAFALRLALEILFFTRRDFDALATVRVVMGWPYTVVVLIASYIYGQSRLKALKGPSVSEFQADAQPPWEGQQRGF